MIDQHWKDFSRWNRHELKQDGRTAMLRNYTDTLLVSIIYILFGIGYGSSTLNVVVNAKSGQSGQIFLDVVSYKEVFHNIFYDGGFFLVNIWNQFLSYSSPLTDGMRHLGSVATAKDVSALIFSLLAFLLVVIFTFLIKNILIVGDRRYFLENRIYAKSQLSRVLFVYKRKLAKKVAWAMFVKSLLQALWTLTVVGGFVKFYSYRLVPFILAENPTLGALEVLTLSRNMMNGNKWRWFCMDLTFLPWHFLSGITFQLAGFLYVYGYIRSTEAFLYAKLREEALEFQMLGATVLNDIPLYQKPAGCDEYYPDYAAGMKKERVDANFGRHYSILHLILLFFVFAAFGWVWEVSLHLIRDGVFVNRGFLHGPWLPVYGFGGIGILLVLKKFRDSVFLTFISTIFLCGVLEYSTSWVMEKTMGKRWWDYSDYLFNLNGRVCLEALLIFAVGGCAIVYLLAPKMDNLLQKIPTKGKLPLAMILIMLFSYDAYYTNNHPNEGHGITSKHQVVVSATILTTLRNEDVVYQTRRP
jgi:uncharacterized membrane protein